MYYKKQISTEIKVVATFLSTITVDISKPLVSQKDSGGFFVAFVKIYRVGRRVEYIKKVIGLPSNRPLAKRIFPPAMCDRRKPVKINPDVKQSKSSKVTGSDNSHRDSLCAFLCS